MAIRYQKSIFREVNVSTRNVKELRAYKTVDGTEVLAGTVQMPRRLSDAERGEMLYKIGLFSDVHIRANVAYDFDKLHCALDKCKDAGVELLIFNGDTFEDAGNFGGQVKYSEPSASTYVQNVEAFSASLKEHVPGVKYCLNSGNHDLSSWKYGCGGYLIEWIGSANSAKEGYTPVYFHFKSGDDTKAVLLSFHNSMICRFTKTEITDPSSAQSNLFYVNDGTSWYSLGGITGFTDQEGRFKHDPLLNEFDGSITLPSSLGFYAVNYDNTLEYIEPLSHTAMPTRVDFTTGSDTFGGLYGPLFRFLAKVDEDAQSEDIDLDDAAIIQPTDDGYDWNTLQSSLLMYLTGVIDDVRMFIPQIRSTGPVYSLKDDAEIAEKIKNSKELIVLYPTEQLRTIYVAQNSNETLKLLFELIEMAKNKRILFVHHLAFETEGTPQSLPTYSDLQGRIPCGLPNDLFVREPNMLRVHGHRHFPFNYQLKKNTDDEDRIYFHGAYETTDDKKFKAISIPPFRERADVQAPGGEYYIVTAYENGWLFEGNRVVDTDDGLKNIPVNYATYWIENRIRKSGSSQDDRNMCGRFPYAY